MRRHSASSTLLQAGAAIVLAAAVVCFALQLLSGPATAAAIAGASLLLLIAAALAAALWGLSVLLRRDVHEFPPEVSRTLSRIQAQLDTLSSRMLEVREQTDTLARFQQARHAQPQVRPEPPLALSPSDLEPLRQQLHELRELILLTDAQRKERLDRYRQERRTTLIKQAFDTVSARQWHEAERLVLALETEYPNDDEVAKARHYLEHARRLNEEETVTRTTREVEEMMTAAAWDQALARAQSLVQGFPQNGQALALLQRVQRERDVYYESTVARMFDELRHDIDRRMWRRACMHAQHLLERFPTHPRAEPLRRQLKTLQDNAEIEERQELEVRIQELIKAQRFDEAIALGEDLIRRYPMSPQAESLDLLLPRLRDLAQHGPQETAFDEYAPGEGADIDEDISTARRSA